MGSFFGHSLMKNSVLQQHFTENREAISFLFPCLTLVVLNPEYIGWIKSKYLKREILTTITIIVHSISDVHKSEDVLYILDL